MIRFLRRLMTGVLVVLAIGVAVLWVRSLTSADALVASRRGVKRELWSVNGRLIAGFEYNPPSGAPLKWSYIRVPDVAPDRIGMSC